MKKTAIITGITGQDGAYLSQLLITKEYRVVGLTREATRENCHGLCYLGVFEKVILEKCNILDFEELEKLVIRYNPDEIYNLAAQSSVRASFESPYETFYFNIQSVLNLLEVIKKVNNKIKFYQASSSEMYGNIGELPITEESIIHPVSPYAISKVTGHLMVINYRESYNFFACCGVLFNHESYLRGDHFFIKKIIKTAIAIKEGRQNELRVGNIDVYRDFGYAPYYVKAMWMMLQQKKAKDYLVCSGESISLREIITYVIKKLEVDQSKILIDKSLFRPNEIQNIYGSNLKAKKELSWDYEYSFYHVLDLLINEEMVNHNNLSSLQRIDKN